MPVALGKKSNDMTLHEFFCIMALQGVIASKDHTGSESAAKVAVEYADALIKELGKLDTPKKA